MKNFLLIFVVTFFSIFSYAQLGLEDVIVEHIDASSVMEGATTYRVFIDLEPGYELQAVMGFEDCPLYFSTTESWYNSEFGGTSSENINAALIESYPELAFDSFLSLGGASSSTWGVSLEDDLDGDIDGSMVINGYDIPEVSTPDENAQLSINENFDYPSTLNALELGLVNGVHIYTFTGNADIAPNNRIMVGQFTTTGVFSFAMNLQVRVPPTNWSHLKSCDFPILTYAGAVGISELSENANDLVVYPTPVQDQLFVDLNLDQSEQLVFSILDVTGKQISSSAITIASGEVTHLINTSTLESGVYLLSVSDDEKGIITKKFTVYR